MNTATNRRSEVAETPIENWDPGTDQITEVVENLLEAEHHEELIEFIRYQDDVLDRNTREIEGVIEGQEEQIRRRMELQENRIEELYRKDNGLDGLDARLRQRIETIDNAMAMRTGIMDRRTDEYMEDLYRRNAEWSNRLDLLRHNLAEGSREKNVRHWDERQEQKRINREYGMAHGTHPSPDSHTHETGPEEPDSHRGRNGRDIPAGQASGAHSTTPGTRERKAEHRGPKGPATGRGTRTGGREPGTKRTHPDPRPKDQGQKPAPHPRYPCEVCGKPLSYYDNFARWWCHTCKTWK